MYDIYSDVPKEESEILWAVVSQKEPSEPAWQGDDDPLLRALVD